MAVIVVVILLAAGSDDGRDPGAGERSDSRPGKRSEPKGNRPKTKPEPKPKPEPAADSIPPAAKPRRVRDVADGDTITLSGLGSSRLIGIDTPEVFFGAECWGAEASAYTKRILTPGTRVLVLPGRERQDRYGRALVYVWLPGGAFFNADLVRKGLAVPLTIAPNDDFADRFERLASAAEQADRGLWARRACNGDPDRPAG